MKNENNLFLYILRKVFNRLQHIYYFVIRNKNYYIDIDNKWHWNNLRDSQYIFDYADVDLLKARYKYLSYADSLITEDCFKNFTNKYASQNWEINRPDFDRNLYYFYRYIKTSYENGLSGIVYLYSNEAIRQVIYDLKLLNVNVISFMFDNDDSKARVDRFITTSDTLKNRMPLWIIANDFCKCSCLLSSTDRENISKIESAFDNNIIYVKYYNFKPNWKVNEKMNNFIKA